MKKSDFIYSLSKNLEDYTEMDVRLSANLIQKAIIESLKKRNRIEIRGFGAFSVKKREARTGRNPRTGERVMVDEKYVPFFKIGKELHDRMNHDYALKKG